MLSKADAYHLDYYVHEAIAGLIQEHSRVAAFELTYKIDLKRAFYKEEIDQSFVDDLKACLKETYGIESRYFKHDSEYHCLCLDMDLEKVKLNERQKADLEQARQSLKQLRDARRKEHSV